MTTIYASNDATQADIVTVWQAAVLGNRAARRSLLQRIMPRSTEEATVIEFGPAATRRKPTRAAA
jgi:hypothetical protein